MTVRIIAYENGFVEITIFKNVHTSINCSIKKDFKQNYIVIQ